MLQFLVSHVFRSSVCVCRAANGGDDDSASFIQMLRACVVFQFCQNKLRACDYGAGTGCNLSKASANPRMAFTLLSCACVAPPTAATTVSPCSFSCSSPVLISNFAKPGSWVVILGPALAAIDPGRP